MRIAICDDDSNYMESRIVPTVEGAVHDAGAAAEIMRFTDGNELIREFENDNGFDIVLLDIDMPAINGKELAGKLRLLNSSFFLAFITSYKTEVFNTIPYRINAFIPKDSPTETMRSELCRVISEYKDFAPEYRLFETLDNGEKNVIRVVADDIFCFCCIRRNVYLKTGNRTYHLVKEKISELAKEYIQQPFYAVNSDVAFESLIFGVEYAFTVILAVLAPASCRNNQQISGVRQHKLRQSQVYDAACVGAVEHCTAL